MIAYCFMPDHVHLLIRGVTTTANARAFIKAAKQYPGYSFARTTGTRLWQRYSYDRVIRSDYERAQTIKYIIQNPVAGGLVREPAEYQFLGSCRYTVGELLQIAELPPEGGSHESMRGP